MSETFLAKIAIRDFRTFGNFEIEIPAAPGLVLLTGTNGLGKSSFFDALEWALTNKIRRFEPYLQKGRKKLAEKDYLTRRGADPGSHKVSLTFSGEEPIERGGGGDTPMAAIISQLMRPERRSIDDIGTYLALTHFLGQAAQQRFTSRNPQDQWQALKGPSGIERLERIRAGLRGRPTVVAFTRRLDQERGVVALLERQIATWQGWTTRLERLRQAARAAGVLSAAEIAERIDTLQTDLMQLVEADPLPISGEEDGSRLAGLGDRINEAQQTTADRKSALASLASLPAQYAAAQAGARLDSPSLLRLRGDLDDVRARIGRAGPLVEAANVAVTAQTGVIATAEQKIAVLDASRTDLSRRAQLAGLIKADEADRLNLIEAIANHRSGLEAADLAVNGHSAAAVEVERLRSLATSAKSLSESMNEYYALEIERGVALSGLNSALATATTAATNLPPLVAQLNELETKIAGAMQARTEAARHASAMGAALSQLARHLHNEETECPVCQSHFEPGVLKELAEAAASSSDSRLAQADETLEALRSQEAGLSSQVEALRVQIAAPEQQQRISVAASNAVADARANIARTLGVAAESDIVKIASDRARDAMTALAAAEAALEPLASRAAAAVEQRSVFIGELEDLIRRESQLGERLTEFYAEDVACTDRIAARNLSSASLDELELRLKDQRGQLEAAREQLARLSEVASAALSGLQREQVALDAALSQLTAAEAARVEADQTAQQLALRWTQAGLPDLPSQAGFERGLVQADEMLARLRSLKERQLVLARDNEDALLQAEVDEIVASMEEAGGQTGANNPAQYLIDLQAKLSTARAAVKLTTGARAAIKRYSEDLQAQADDFSNRVLDPLNDVIDDFNEAMLSTPGESIQFKADTRVDATSFGMALRYREKVENAIEAEKDLPPQVVLSEGQLAANGFSILCAASTAYPWSRWRALLLDDPLQHNDIIHTAAFVDVMRNMVELNGYQLVMSSHDRGESDFIARKFEAAGLPCTRILLTAPSDQGVVWEPPEQNQAAMRILHRDAQEANSNSA